MARASSGWVGCSLQVNGLRIDQDQLVIVRFRFGGGGGLYRIASWLRRPCPADGTAARMHTTHDVEVVRREVREGDEGRAPWGPPSFNSWLFFRRLMGSRLIRISWLFNVLGLGGGGGGERFQRGSIGAPQGDPLSTARCCRRRLTMHT